MRVPARARQRPGLATWLAMLALVAAPAAARELAAPVEDFVEVEVATVGLATPSGTPVVLLREPEGSEVLPIFIGPEQARSILRAMRGVEMPRPMTHDLLGEVIGSLDARLARVYVDGLVDSTFLGMLELEVAGRDRPIRVDTRPSDAIAIALRVGADILVAPEVMERTELIGYRGLEEDQQIVTAVGITVMATTPRLREALELPDMDGLVVTRAVGIAKGAGIEAGALLLSVNAQTPGSPMNFLELVQATPKGELARIRYWFDCAVEEIEIPTVVPDRPGAVL